MHTLVLCIRVVVHMHTVCIRARKIVIASIHTYYAYDSFYSSSSSMHTTRKEYELVVLAAGMHTAVRMKKKLLHT